MSDLKVFTLPNRDEMMRRLTSVMDEPHAIQNFYPLLARHAGEEKAGMGVVMMLQLAIHDYTQGMPPIMANILQMRVDDFLKALIDDEEALEEALTMMRTVRNQASGQ